MSKKKKAAAAAVATHTATNAVSDAYSAVRESPYLQRAVTDEELRDNVKVAYESARTAYERLASSKKPPKAVLNDKKLHSEIATAAQALRDIGNTLVEAPKSPTPAKKKGGLGRKLLLLVVGAGVALAVSSDLRTKVLDLLFGAEEEFDYTSSTTPATPPPAPASPPPAGGGTTAGPTPGVPGA